MTPGSRRAGAEALRAAGADLATNRCIEFLAALLRERVKELELVPRIERLDDPCAAEAARLVAAARQALVAAVALCECADDTHAGRVYERMLDQVALAEGLGVRVPLPLGHEETLVIGSDLQRFRAAAAAEADARSAAIIVATLLDEVDPALGGMSLGSADDDNGELYAISKTAPDLPTAARRVSRWMVAWRWCRAPVDLRVRPGRARERRPRCRAAARRAAGVRSGLDPGSDDPPAEPEPRYRLIAPGPGSPHASWRRTAISGFTVRTSEESAAT